MKRFTVIIYFVLLLVAFGFWFTTKSKPDAEVLRVGSTPERPTLTFYTSGLATTPQLALWHAAKKGDLLTHCNLQVKIWKNLDDLRGTILAGKGDLWLGHTEGFVQAAQRGADLKLLAVTAWRKFYLVTTDPKAKTFKDWIGKELAFAPTGSPAVPILQETLKNLGSIAFKPGEGRQIAMLLMKGEIKGAVVPEPLVSMLEKKVEGLYVGENVESLYGKAHHGEPRMPIAGLAIRGSLEKEHPGLTEAIMKSLEASGRALAGNPEAGIACLPESFQAFVKPGVVKASLKRDRIEVKRASQVKDELMRYLAVIMKSKAPSDKEFQTYLF